MTFVEMAQARPGFYRRKGWTNFSQILLNDTITLYIIGESDDNNKKCHFLTEEDIEANDWYEIFMGG